MAHCVWRDEEIESFLQVFKGKNMAAILDGKRSYYILNFVPPSSSRSGLAGRDLTRTVADVRQDIEKKHLQIVFYWFSGNVTFILRHTVMKMQLVSPVWETFFPVSCLICCLTKKNSESSKSQSFVTSQRVAIPSPTSVTSLPAVLAALVLVDWSQTEG